MDIKAANVSENITPREYTDLLFDGIGAALVFNFKRLKREEFDGLKPKIDWGIVESFPFPAPFEEQRYIGDGGKIHVWSISENSWVEQSAHHHHEVLNRAIAQHLMQDDLQENLDRL